MKIIKKQKITQTPQLWQSAGFTLIEMIVSLTIIALISTVATFSYRSTNNRSDLIMATHVLASNIRLAQNYTLGLKEAGGNYPIGGWGVRFETGANANFYTIFFDNDASHTFNDINEEHRKVYLPAGITISNIDLGSPTDIVFEPPDPTTWIINSGSNYTSVIITVQGSAGSTKDVEVNFLGLIDVVN